MKKASGYALGKSFFLATPMIWIVGMEFFEKSIDKLKKENIDYFFDKIKRYLIDAKNYTAQIFGVVFILAITIVIFREAGLGFPMEKIEFFPAASNNLNTIFINKNKRVDISSDQLKFIDEIKNNYNGLLDDNRLLIIAPSDMAMWVFAYSGIWTRPYSMMPPGAENKGIYSPMSFYSREIADYRQWLFNDKDHYIALLNCGEAEGWAKKFGFNENDYENIYSDNYGNELLKLKSGVSTRFIYSEELDIRRDYAGKGWDGDKNKIIKISPIPISSEIVSRYSNLSGLFFNISISGKEKKSLNSDYLFKLKNGKCEENGSSVFEKIISKEDVKNIPAGQPIKIFFDNPIADSANKSFCFDFSRVKKLNNEEKETLSLILKDNIADHAEIYNYINK